MPSIYKTAATPAAIAPASMRPFLTEMDPAPLPESEDEVALALEPVELEVPDELLVLSLAAPKTPPCTVAGEDPCAFSAADLYASRVFSVDLETQRKEGSATYYYIYISLMCPPKF